MSNSVRQYPFFKIYFSANAQLQEQGGNPWVYHATTMLQFVQGEGTRRQRSKALPMRLDTGAFVSLLPAEWLASFQLRQFLHPSLRSIPFQTAAGIGQGKLARGVGAVFVNDPASQVIHFDCLVTENLNGRGYGLLSLKDVVNHFFIQAEGRLEFDEDLRPLELPDLVLVPRQVWDRVRYFCPNCRSGLSGGVKRKVQWHGGRETNSARASQLPHSATHSTRPP